MEVREVRETSSALWQVVKKRRETAVVEIWIWRRLQEEEEVEEKGGE